jgi:hypothetical protein
MIITDILWVIFTLREEILRERVYNGFTGGVSRGVRVRGGRIKFYRRY